MKNLLSLQAMKNKEVISLTPYNITLQFIYFYIRTGEITCLFHIRMYHTGEKLICCKFFHSFYADITESMECKMRSKNLFFSITDKCIDCRFYFPGKSWCFLCKSHWIFSVFGPKKDLKGISQKVLTDSLRLMEEDGICPIPPQILSGSICTRASNPTKGRPEP